MLNALLHGKDASMVKWDREIRSEIGSNVSSGGEKKKTLFELVIFFSSNSSNSSKLCGNKENLSDSCF